MDSQTYFKEVATEWDTLSKRFFNEGVREKAYRVANVKEGSVAADIGAGTGFLTEGLLQKGLNVIAVDRSTEMLEQMAKKFTQYNGLTLKQGEAEALPITSDTVDYAMANMFLHHVENPLNTIIEMVRIIKPGGKLVITDLDAHDHDFLITEHHDRWMGFDRVEIQKWLSDAGLKNVLVDCVEGNCCTTSNCGNESAEISIFIAYGEK